MNFVGTKKVNIMNSIIIRKRYQECSIISHYSYKECGRKILIRYKVVLMYIITISNRLDKINQSGVNVHCSGNMV